MPKTHLESFLLQIRPNASPARTSSTDEALLSQERLAEHWLWPTVPYTQCTTSPNTEQALVPAE
eukprot:5128526-Amphidinium_carterae.1